MERQAKSGFNRYIVECKVSIIPLVKDVSTDLIDTLWNVKVPGGDKPLRRKDDLIDTLWNVKFFLDLMVLGDRY